MVNHQFLGIPFDLFSKCVSHQCLCYSSQTIGLHLYMLLMNKFIDDLFSESKQSLLQKLLSVSRWYVNHLYIFYANLLPRLFIIFKNI